MQKYCFFNNMKNSTIGSTESKTGVHIETLSAEVLSKGGCNDNIIQK